MTRELQISDAAQMSDLCGNLHDLDCFVAGAQWADSHPHWHKFPDEKPPCEDQYLIVTTDKTYLTAEYRDDHFLIDHLWTYHIINDQDIVAWKELPELPKFDWT